MLRILIGLVIGAVLGLALPGWTGIGILGRIFVSALKSIAPVLVAVLVISSIAKAGKGLGRRFTSLVAIYLLSTFIAAVCAVVGSFLFPVTLPLGEVARTYRWRPTPGRWTTCSPRCSPAWWATLWRR